MVARTENAQLTGRFSRVLTHNEGAAPHHRVGSRWPSWACAAVSVNMGLAKRAGRAQGEARLEGGLQRLGGGTKSSLRKGCSLSKGLTWWRGSCPLTLKVTRSSYGESPCREASGRDPQNASPQHTPCLTPRCQRELLLDVWSPGNPSLVSARQ